MKIYVGKLRTRIHCGKAIALIVQGVRKLRCVVYMKKKLMNPDRSTTSDRKERKGKISSRFVIPVLAVTLELRTRPIVFHELRLALRNPLTLRREGVV